MGGNRKGKIWIRGCDALELGMRGREVVRAYCMRERVSGISRGREAETGGERTNSEGKKISQMSKPFGKYFSLTHCEHIERGQPMIRLVK